MLDNKEKFTKPYDTAVFAYDVLRRLGSGKVSSFIERLLSQKTQYFAQLFGVSPAYQFGLYVRGPYSSDLAHDLFAMQLEKLPPLKKFVSDELENRFRQLDKFLEGKDARSLEIISTLHWLMKVVGLTTKDAKTKLQQLKEATEIEYQKAIQSIEKIEQQIK